MLCKNENRNPEHCLAEGRKVTRCAQAVISKLRENCLQEFDNHWKCLENNNQVSLRFKLASGIRARPRCLALRTLLPVVRS